MFTKFHFHQLLESLFPTWMKNLVSVVCLSTWGCENRQSQGKRATPERLLAQLTYHCDCSDNFVKGEVRRKMNFMYVLGFVMLRGVVKVFPVSSSSFARKTTKHEVTRGHDAAWRQNGSQIVSSESDRPHPILVYLSRNHNSQAQARRFPALTAPEHEFPVIFGTKWDPLTSAWR